VAAEILAGICAQTEEEIDDLPVPEEALCEDDDDALFEGLDRRYGALVSEIGNAQGGLRPISSNSAVAQG
jgi:hypothetical protein